MRRLVRRRFSLLTLVFAGVLALGTTALGTGLALGTGSGSRAGTIDGANAVAQGPSPAQVSTVSNVLSLFAFYYIDLSPDSSKPATSDRPLLGDYSSHNAAALEQQMVWAKSAGIQGWFVSWNDTAPDNRGLKLLVQVATREHFKLAVICQGLDIDGKTPPGAETESEAEAEAESEAAKEFQTFVTQFAPDPVFLKIGGKALTIWGDTSEFTPAQVEAVTAPVRGKLLVLGTQDDVASYQQIARYTDGDVYPWSPTDPQADKGYPAELTALAAAVHGDDGYWIASFGPGFDAQPVGGTGAVPRDGGQTLRAEYAAALASSPDMLGVTSWNGFDEDSSIEPSKKYGHFYLNALAALREASVPTGELDVDSSSSSGVFDSYLPDGLLLAGAMGMFAGLVGLRVALRPRAQRRASFPPLKEYR